MVVSDAGEDTVVFCECGYAANMERAVSSLAPVDDDWLRATPKRSIRPARRPSRRSATS